MLSLIPIVILLAHGCLHLIGFAHEFKLVKLPETSSPPLLRLSPGAAKIVGLLWLLCALLFSGSAALHSFGLQWWPVAAAGLFISQLLILLYWRDAKAGTIVNLLVLAIVVSEYGQRRFERLIEHDRSALVSSADREVTILTNENTKHLPLPVSRWIAKSGAIGQPRIHRISLKQTGEMRTSPDGQWMPFTANQIFTTHEPGFLWTVKVRIGPGLQLQGRDLLLDGRGKMRIELLSLFPIADASGPQIDQGALVRYLAEVVWFPGVALSSFIHWEPIDRYTAMATLKSERLSVNARFSFNEDYDVTGIEADRFMDRNGTSTLERWHIEIDPQSIEDFPSSRGKPLRIPTESRVSWKLKEGDFLWLKLKIHDVIFE